MLGFSNRQIAKILKRSHKRRAYVSKMGSSFGVIKRLGRSSTNYSRQIREIVRKTGEQLLKSFKIKQVLGINLSTRRIRQILHSAENI